MRKGRREESAVLLRIAVDLHYSPSLSAMLNSVHSMCYDIRMNGGFITLKHITDR